MNIPIITPLWNSVKLAWLMGYRYPKALLDVQKQKEQKREGKDEGGG